MAWRWHNVVDWEPINWFPDELQKEHDAEKRREWQRRFYESLGAEQPGQSQEWNEYLAYLSNYMMNFMNPLDAASTAKYLVGVDPEFSNAYAKREFGFNPAYNMRAGPRADYYYNIGAKWDAILEGLKYANQQIFGDIEQPPGAAQDPGPGNYLTGVQGWLENLAALGKRYGLDTQDAYPGRPLKTRLNRYELEDLAREWNDLQQASATVDPTGTLKQLGERLLLPTQYSLPGSPVAFRLGNYRSVPAGGGVAANYAYRNQRYA